MDLILTILNLRKMGTDMDTKIGADLSESEQENLSLFLERLKKINKGKSAGAIGGSLTYHITHTGLGTVVKVTDAISGLEADITDYGSW